MALESKSEVIDGVEYTTTQFPARFGFRLKVTLGKKLAPALSNLLGGVGASPSLSVENLLDTEIDPGRIGKALEGLFSNLTDTEAEALLLQILSQTRRDTHGGEGGQFLTGEIVDQEYAGDYLTLYKVVGFALKVNYGSLLSGGGLFTFAGNQAPAGPTPESSA